MSNFHWSYSSITDFEQCASKYNHTRILKDVKSIQGVEAAEGEAAHKVLEKYLLHKNTPQCPVAGFRNADCLSFALRCADVFLKTPRTQLLVELEMGLDRDLNPVPYRSAYGRGKADIVLLGDIGPNGPSTANLYDWKSGKIREKTDQLKLYSWMLWRHYPTLERIFYRYIWFNYGAITPRTGDDDGGFITSKGLIDFASSWMHRVRKVENQIESGIMVPTPSALCPWCPVTKAVCPVKRGKR